MGNHSEDPIVVPVPERRRARPTSHSQQTLLLGAMTGLWQRLRMGAVVLEDASSVAYINNSARRALRSRTSVRLVGEKLITNHAALGSMLCRPAGRAGIAQSTALEDDHLPPNRRLLVATRLPMRRRADPCILLLCEPLATHAPSLSYLCEAHGLTSTESLVVNRVVAGLSLQQCATELGVSIHTIRTHMKRIFAKCRCRTQADLIRQLSLGPTGFVAFA